MQTPKGGSAAEDGRDAISALGLDEVDDDGMGEATRAAISAAAPEVPLDADSGSEEEGEEDDVDDDDDEDAAEDDGDWDVALRGLRLPVGTRVFVDEGTKGGVIGRRAERAWRRRGRHGRGRRGDPRAARGIENSRRVAQQRGRKRGSPGRETNTDQAFEITPA